MDYVYHGSPVNGLTHLEPRRSTHGNNWVYATNNRAIAIIHSQKWSDYIFNESISDGEQLELTERLLDAFEEVYKGKPSYLYSGVGENYSRPCQAVCVNSTDIIFQPNTC